MGPEFYQFTATSLNGEEIIMDSYRGKIVLIVNTASKCGFAPQLKGLEKLYRKYRDKGLIILGFPCNQFGNQEPGDEKSISDGCIVNYGVKFPLFSKIKVNGDKAHPLFKYLKKELNGLFGSRIKWNFTKFLVDRNGKPVKRFGTLVRPERIGKYLEKIMN